MPETRAAEWSQVRFRCSTIGCLRPGAVSVAIHERDFDCDEELLRDDPVGTLVCTINGRELALRQDFVPADLRRPNSEFWLAIDNTGRWMLFRHPDDIEPERTVGGTTA